MFGSYVLTQMATRFGQRYLEKKNTSMLPTASSELQKMGISSQVETIVAGDHAAGTFKATWDASGMTSGVYFYRLTAGDYVQTRKMSLMK